MREGIPVRCGMLCAALELVTMRKKKSQFIFFITLLCLKDSAQMHVGSVLVLALIRNCSVKKTSSWCTTSDTQLEYFHVDFCQECFLKVADYFWALKDLV